MIITCPNCETKFNLPDEQARVGAQLRCSVCKHVFEIPDTGGRMPGQAPEKQAPPRVPEPEPDVEELDFDDAPESEGGSLELSLHGDLASSATRRKQKKSGKGCLIAAMILLLLAGGGAGAWFFAGDAIKARLPFLLGQPAAPAKDMISKIALRGVRQYSLNNEKNGRIFVIEGKAVNGFDEPRELIKVEAFLYDKDGKTLDSKQQLAGTSVSLFQLQVLGEKELEQALGNRIEILSNNTNVPPGGEVPFMVVFYKQPDAAAEFAVKVIEAKNPPKK